jgi:hypothetical protein
MQELQVSALRPKIQTVSDYARHTAGRANNDPSQKASSIDMVR